jgi:predicted small lipoprotein YifL
MMKPLLLLATLCFALTACGQTGPLYLPEDKPAQESSFDDEDDF